MMEQDPKKPLWIVTLRIATSRDKGTLLYDAKGQEIVRAGKALSWGDAHDMTVHAQSAEAAKAFVLQQNPDAEVTAVKELANG